MVTPARGRGVSPPWDQRRAVRERCSSAAHGGAALRAEVSPFAMSKVNRAATEVRS
jgi:hypothetical protein